MGQIVKARSPNTLRQKKNIARNAAHREARKTAAQKGAAKAHHKKTKTARKNSSLKEQIMDLSSAQKNRPQKAKTRAPRKPPDTKSAPQKTKKKTAKRKTVSQTKTVKQSKRKKTTSAIKNIKNINNNQNDLQNIPFIFQHKADNILYYTQASEGQSLILEDHKSSSETPITPRSFAPISAVREPLSEYLILQKKRKQKRLNQPVQGKTGEEDNSVQSIHIKNIISENKPPEETPLPRSSSLVMAEQRPLHILAYWLRTSRYKLLNIFKRSKQEKEAQKKRSKADILNEIAGLRAENAMLRKKLGKVIMPNGRKKFEKA